MTIVRRSARRAHCRATRIAPEWTPSANGEVDDDLPRLALAILDRHGVAVTGAHLVQQRQRIVVVDEPHGLAGPERVERAEDGRVTEALRDPARVERVELVGRKVQVRWMAH